MNQSRSISYALLFALLTFSSAFTFIKKGDWFLLKAEEYGYQIEFPKEPKENPQIIQSAIGELKLNIFLYDASTDNQKDENLVYLVNFTTYPDSLVNSDDTAKLSGFYRGSIDGAVNNVQGKLLSEKEIELGKFSGREVKIDFQQGRAIINMRIFLIHNNMYMVQTITETKKDNNKAMKRFFDSFQLL